MAWNPIATGDISQDKPTTTTLWQKVKDCLDYLYASGPQIYTTEGVEVIANRSFEQADGSSHPSDWTTSEDAYIDISVESTNSSKSGAKRIKATTSDHTAQGSITSGYMEINPDRLLWGGFNWYTDNLALNFTAAIYFYKGDKTACTSPNRYAKVPSNLLHPASPSITAALVSLQEGTDISFGYIANIWHHIPIAVLPPDDARFCKIKIEFYCASGSGYTCYIDDLKLEQPRDELRYFIEASDSLLNSSDSEVTGPTAQTWTKLKEAVVLETGTYRVKFDMAMVGTHVGLSVKGRIYKNDLAFGTERTVTGEAYTTFSEDLFFNEGDYISLYGYGTGDDGHAVRVKNFRFYGDEHPIALIITKTS